MVTSNTPSVSHPFLTHCSALPFHPSSHFDFLPQSSHVPLLITRVLLSPFTLLKICLPLPHNDYFVVFFFLPVL